MAASLELAISAIRSGRKEEGRQLLNLLIQQNPNNEMAWVWMSSVVETDEQRARCLYHALAINPSSQLARRGLQVLGIVVSDSRPVKIPRDSQPIQIPRPTLSSQPQLPTPEMIPPETGPIPAKTITEELPFIPVQESTLPKIEASPSILHINVDDFAMLSGDIPIPEADEAPANSGDSPTKTQQMPSPFIQNKGAPATEPQSGEAISPQPDPPGPNLAGVGTPDPSGQPQAPGGMIPNDTRPSQPMVPVYPQNMPAGQFYYPGLPAHSNTTMGMPPQVYGQYPGQPMSPHSNPTMGMPLPGYPMYPQGMMPDLHSNATMGMTPYPQPQFQVPSPYHSSSTMLMPTLSEAEARARLSTSHAIPTASATAMALQHQAPPPPMASDPGFDPYLMGAPEKEEEEGEELNILAVIIFGTLSITALGGLGMLILLLFTSPMTSG